MSHSGLWQDIKANPYALVIAVVLHGVMIVLLSINLIGSEVHVPKRAPQKTVEAVVVDSAAVDREIEKLKAAERKKQQKLKQQQDKLKKQVAAEKKRLAELKKKEAAEKKKKAAAEKKRKQEARRKAEAEKKKKAAAEAKRQAEAEQKRKAEAEKRRKAELAKQEAERKRKEAEARQKAKEEELKRKIAEEERLEREAREAAEREKVLDSLRLQYVRMIEQKVERSWLKPAGINNVSACEVYVTQSRLGDVMNVELSDCEGEAVYLRSIERAVYRASPLPSPPDTAVFDREIHFVFRPGR